MYDLLDIRNLRKIGKAEKSILRAARTIVRLLSKPNHDVQIILEELNALVSQEEQFGPTVGKFSDHQLTNENGVGHGVLSRTTL